MLLFSFYQAYRGFKLQWILGIHRSPQQSSTSVASAWSKTDVVFVLCLADALFFFVSTTSGFLALYAAYLIVVGVPSIQDISNGTSAVLIFLGLIGVLGISGQLAPLLQQGKFPK